VTNGSMDSIPVDKVRNFEGGLRRFVSERFPDLLEHIRSTGDLPKEERLQEAIGAFKESFQAAD
jgi:F-type H+-transporting ATPase subunit alpha